ncbi:CopG family ribbon-helix-helix protein [Rhodospirillum sp. A1_3_36]|uniref:CopG family ribbon-helix-helix protein n=1 Tax=Rhodospirillum sp. A1_3_36 TaxID=3391666 RepID=UPI0039A761D6
MLSNFTFRVDDDLKAAFVLAAKANNRTASLLVRDYMAAYVEAQDHDNWFSQQVKQGLAEAADPATKTIAHDDVAADIMIRLNGR